MSLRATSSGLSLLKDISPFSLFNCGSRILISNYTICPFGYQISVLLSHENVSYMSQEHNLLCSLLYTETLAYVQK